MGKNLINKIISFIFALIIWIAVYNIYDPVITVEMKNVEVLITNESVLSSFGKVYNIDEGSRINFFLKGKQSIVKSIDKSDIKATADLSKLSDVNAVKIDISIPSVNSKDVTIINGDIDTLKVILDNYVTKSFKILVNPKNTISDKYYLKSNNMLNTYVRISGPQQEINKISEVYIEPNLEYVYPKYSTTLDIKATDSFGTVINLNNLELSTKTINYNPTILNIKEVPITVNFDITIPFGYELISRNFSPKEIKVTGNDDVLNKFNRLNIYHTFKDLTKNEKLKIDLYDYIPEGLFIVSDNKIIELNVLVEKLETRRYDLELSDIISKNMPESMVISYLDNPDLYIEVMGKKDIINNLEIKDILPYIDFDGLSLGEHLIEVRSLNKDLEIISASSLNIELKTEIIIQDNSENFNETKEDTKIENNNKEDTKIENNNKEDTDSTNIKMDIKNKL